MNLWDLTLMLLTRSCNAIAWNPEQMHLLAVGLDKVRGDFSTIVWDVTYGKITFIFFYIS